MVKTVADMSFQKVITTPKWTRGSHKAKHVNGEKRTLRYIHANLQHAEVASAVIANRFERKIKKGIKRWVNVLFRSERPQGLSFGELKHKMYWIYDRKRKCNVKSDNLNVLFRLIHGPHIQRQQQRGCNRERNLSGSATKLRWTTFAI